MNDVQAKIVELQDKGWTLAALADELNITPNAVEKWKAGERYPANSKAIFTLLNQLLNQERIPKKRRYPKGVRRLNHSGTKGDRNA
jgi:ribosome-binding protein aMBF1 (putative translation factor)